jgi:YVTN family beta-propeller protein
MKKALRTLIKTEFFQLAAVCAIFLLAASFIITNSVKAEQQIKNITIPGAYGVAVDSNKGVIYVASNSMNELYVLDRVSHNILKAVTVGKEPVAVAVSPTNQIYVVNQADKTVSVIDGTSYSILETVSVGDFPLAIAVSPTNQIYVVNQADKTVSVIDGTTHNVVKTVTVGLSPYLIAFDSNNCAYVTNNLEDTVSVIDGTTHNVIKTVSVGKEPRGVAFDPNKNRILVVNQVSTFLSVIDPDNYEVGKLELGLDSYGYLSLVAVNPVSNHIYLQCKAYGGMQILDGTTDKFIQRIRFGSHNINSIAVDSSTNRFYSTDRFDDHLQIIDGNENNVINTIELSPDNPDQNFTAMAVNENLNRIYVANPSNGSVSVISGFYDQIIANVSLVDSSTSMPLWPIKLEVNINTDDLYVLNASGSFDWEPTVSIIDGINNKEIDIDGDPSNGVTRIKLGPSYTYTGCIAMHQEKNRIYVGHNTKLFVIDGDDYSIIDKIDVGLFIQAITVDSRRNEIYIAAVMSMVRVIDGETGDTIADIEIPFGAPYPIQLLYHQTETNDRIFLLTTGMIYTIDPVTHSIPYKDDDHISVSALDIGISPGTNPIGTQNLDHLIIPTRGVAPYWTGPYLLMNRPHEVVYSQNIIAVDYDAIAVSVNPKTKRIYLLHDHEGSDTVSVIGSIDETMILAPKKKVAVQDWTMLIARILPNIMELEEVGFSVREDDLSTGIDIDLENLPATYNLTTGYWEYSFNSTVLPDGNYVILTKAVDISGNEKWSMLQPFSIRNWAVIELLPATESNKAGRVVPVKFALRALAAVDPNMPFVYNENLEIKIYKASDTGSILQTSVYGDSSKDYRIDTDGEKYITNFKTDKKPAEYVVEIWRPSNGFLVGSFTFETVK